MPPEPLPWDRKDFFKERKHERPEPHNHQAGGGGSSYGGVGGFGGGPRWREPPYPHPHPYHYASSARWASDFRYRPPPGYGKQGGRYMYAEESSHGFVPSRSAERMSDDESCRSSGTGKYVRNSRDNRGPFSHKDLKGHSWDAAPNGPGRLNGTIERQRSVDAPLRPGTFERQRSVDAPGRPNGTFERQRSVDGPGRLNVAPEQQRSVDGPGRLNVVLEQQRSVALEQQRSVALEQQRSVSLEQQRSVALEQQRSVALEQQRSVALEQLRSVALEQQRSGALEQQRSAALALEQQRAAALALEQQRAVALEQQRAVALEQQRSVYGPGRPNNALELQRSVYGPERRNGTFEPQCALTGPGRLNGTLEPQRSNDILGNANGSLEQQMVVDDMVTYNPSQPQLEAVHSWGQTQFKEQPEKVDGVHHASGNSGQKLERENSMGSADWKPLKWTRSGSSSSRGSGFSLSSSSKSLGADSAEMKAELLPSNYSPLQSPSGDAVMTSALKSPCEVSAALSEETRARKKPRLGWGEGLAKFEKKKVDGVDVTTPRNGTYSSCRDPVKVPHSTQLADHSPTINGFPDCSSPATPSSVGCSSSPGLEEKQSTKSGHANQPTSDFSLSSGAVPQNHIEESTFDLENLDLAQSGCLSSAINNLLQSGDPSGVDSGFVKSTAMNKLKVLKGDVLNKLEMTVQEIDKLEGELKSLIVVPDCSSLRLANPCSLPVHGLAVSQEQDATSNTAHRPAPLELVSPRENDREKNVAKNNEVDSPGSATSKFIEVLSPMRKDISSSETKADVKGVSVTNVGDCVRKGQGSEIAVCVDASQLVPGCPTHVDHFQVFIDIDSQNRESILASNKESANRAAEVLNKLVPADFCNHNISSDYIVRISESDSLVKKRYLKRRRAVQFKKRIITLKFRALQYLWKEDVRSLSLGKSRIKSHKKLDLSSRAVNSSSQKHRSSIRSRLSCTAGNSSSANSELIVLIGKLLSDSKLKPCRDALKMPAMVLDRKEKLASRFISSNGLVEDPCAAEKERSLINPWTSEEKEIFMDKFTTYGKDFTKIASFIAHKTTADCVEFYYKNHKFDWFKKTKKPASCSKQGKLHSANNYLVASGKRWNYESNAASLDILGAASAIAAKADGGSETLYKCSSKYMIGRSTEYNTSRGNHGIRPGGLDMESNERETVAADVLAGICGSMSSEAMSSSIAGAVDAGEHYHEWRSRKVGSLSRWPTTPEGTQNVDDETCSDESCGEMDLTPWSDEEKSMFVQAVSSYGRDFTMISRCVSTRDEDQCRTYFSKVRKALGINLSPSECGTPVGDDDDNGGLSDTDDACGVETSSVICSEKSELKMVVELQSPGTAKGDPALSVATVEPDLNQFDENNGSENTDVADMQLVSEDLVDDPRVDENFESKNSDFVETQLPSKDLVDSSQVDDKQTHEKSSSSSEPVDVPEHECVRDCDQPNKTVAQDESKPVDTPDVRLAAESSGPLPLENMKNKATDTDFDLRAVQISRTYNEASESQSLVSGGLAADLKLAELELGSSTLPVSTQNPCVQLQHPCVQLQHESYPVPLSLAPQVSAIKCGEVPIIAVPLSSVAVTVDSEQSYQAGAGQKFIAGVPLISSIDTPQILLNYPVLGPTNGEVRTLTYPKRDKNIHQDQLLASESLLQRCNGFQKHTSTAELPFRTVEQPGDANSGHRSTSSLGDTGFRSTSSLGEINSSFRSTSSFGDTNSGYRSSSSSDAEKPRQNGDVKLFGQILSKPSLQQKIDLSAQQNRDIRNHQASSLDKHFSPRYAVSQSINGTVQTKVDRHNLAGANHHPMRRYWDGPRVQTGFNPPLPDSALLLAKYPDAFGNYVMPSSKLELPLNALNGAAAILQGRELVGSSVSAMADFQAYRNLELQRQGAVLSEMQRRNGFDLVAGVQQHQQQTRGVVGQNGRRNLLVGGSSQCTSVSDPVAAMRMHYTNANSGQQRNGGSMIREEDPWRGKGNIGR